MPDMPAAMQAQEAALGMGLNLDGHLSRQVDAEMLKRFDLVIVMEAGQAEAMSAEFPDLAGKMFLLSVGKT